MALQQKLKKAIKFLSASSALLRENKCSAKHDCFPQEIDDVRSLQWNLIYKGLGAFDESNPMGQSYCNRIETNRKVWIWFIIILGIQGDNQMHT